MCGQLVYLMSQQGYSDEQIDRAVPFGVGFFTDFLNPDAKRELPENLTKYNDYVIKKTMERHERRQRISI